MKSYVIMKIGGLYLAEVARENDASQTEYLWTTELSLAKRFDEEQAAQQAHFLTFWLLGVQYEAEAVEV